MIVMLLVMMLLSAKCGDYCEGDCQKQHGVQDWKAVPLSGKDLHFLYQNLCHSFH